MDSCAHDWNLLVLGVCLVYWLTSAALTFVVFRKGRSLCMLHPVYLIGVLEEFCFCFVLFYKSFDSFGVYS